METPEKIDLEKYDFKRNLLFTGPTGTLKTTTAKKIIQKFDDENFHEKLKKYIITDWEFKQLVKSNNLNLRKPEASQTDITYYPLEMLVRSWILLYDDLWVSDTSEAYLRDLTYVLDKRIEKDLVTIFTTNLTKSELKEKLNDRILSRVLLNTDVVIFQWEDRRLETTRYYTI